MRYAVSVNNVCMVNASFRHWTERNRHNTIITLFLTFWIFYLFRLLLVHRALLVYWEWACWVNALYGCNGWLLLDGHVDCEDVDCCRQVVCVDSPHCTTAPDPLHILLRKQPPSSTSSFYERVKFLIDDDSVQNYADRNSFDHRSSSLCHSHSCCSHVQLWRWSRVWHETLSVGWICTCTPCPKISDTLHCKKRVFRNTELSGNPAATRLVHPNTQFGCFASWLPSLYRCYAVQYWVFRSTRGLRWCYAS